jgi:hypothetical protein
LRAIRPEYKEILLNSEIIAVNQDVAARQGRMVKKGGDDVQWYTLPLTSLLTITITAYMVHTCQY